MRHTDFIALLDSNETWLMERILDYASRHDFTKYTSTLVEAWRMSISGLSESLREAASQGLTPSEFHPDADYTANPMAAFGILEAQLHRKRGLPLGMFLGLFKYYRQAYLDLLEDKVPGEEEREAATLFISRCFDLFELALCQEWAGRESGEQLDELRDANRRLTNEKNKYLTLFESISDPAFLVDGEGRIQHMNLAATTFLRIPVFPGEIYYSREEDPGHGARGKPLGEFLPWLGDEVDSLLRVERTTARAERSVEHLGEKRHFKVAVSKMLDISGKYAGAVALLSDITDQKQAEYALVCSERDLTTSRDLLRLLIDGLPALISYVDTGLRYQFANAYYTTVFGLRPEELIGRTVRDLIGEEAFSQAEPRYAAALEGEAQHFEMDFTAPSGHLRNFNVDYIPHVVSGEVVGVIALIMDETQRKRAEAERQRFFDVSLDMLCVLGFDGRFHEVNAAWTRTLGWTHDELLAKPLMELVHPDDAAATAEAEENLRNGESVIAFENRCRCKDGGFRWVTWNSFPIPKEGLIYAVAHDTTKRREMEEELKRLATKDSLTGTNNRRHFMELATGELDRSVRYDRPLAMLMVDIDHFKRINDTHGHPAGDEVLRKLVRTMARALRKSDILGRIGGEEFAALLPETDRASAERTAERIRTDVEALTVRHGDLAIRLTISVGLAAMEKPGETLDELLKRSDDALYEAKRGGRNRVVAADAPKP